MQQDVEDDDDDEESYLRQGGKGLRDDSSMGPSYVDTSDCGGNARNMVPKMRHM
jgi:hypothetical protein